MKRILKIVLAYILAWILARIREGLIYNARYEE